MGQLIHWTGRGKTEAEALDVLRNICKSRLLRLTYADRFRGNPKYKIRMVCFTEIPLQDCRFICQKFGKIGIGFNRETLYKYGVRPVAYVSCAALKDVFNPLLKVAA